MPIKGLSEQRRLPRLGKIHLGKKVPNKNKDGEHPEATTYFVLPPELENVFGKECAALPIMIPVEDDELWASQYYKRYSNVRGLTCRGDGVTCRRMVDTKTGEVANRKTEEIVWKEGLPCQGQDCPDYKAKECKEVMNLQFIMPDVPGLGIWQVDTSSVNSIRNINSGAAMVRAVYKRLVFIPLLLTLEPQEVVNPDDGKKKTVRCLNLRVRGTMKELMAQASKPFTELLLPAPADTEPPLDNGEVESKQAEVMTDEEARGMWGEGPSTQTAQAPAPVAKPAEAPTGKDKPARDLESIKTYNDLCRACNADFGIKSSKDVLVALGFGSQSDINVPMSECYKAIKKMKDPNAG